MTGVQTCALPIWRVPDVLQLGILGGRGDRPGRGVPSVAVPANHAGRGQGKELAAEGSFVARDRGLRAGDRVGILDRLESAAVFPGAGTAGGAYRGEGASGLLRGASSGEPVGRGGPQRLAAV